MNRPTLLLLGACCRGSMRQWIAPPTSLAARDYDAHRSLWWQTIHHARRGDPATARAALRQAARIAAQHGGDDGHERAALALIS
jgi:hypothetical protein